MFEALTDPSRWLTPEVLVAALAFVVGLVAAIAAIWTVCLEYGNRARALADKKAPMVAVSIGSGTGWHGCNVTVQNRADADIMLTGVEVVSDKGFLLAKELSGSVQRIDEASASKVLNPGWSLPPSPEPRRRLLLFVRPPDGFRPKHETPIILKFRVEILDAERTVLSVEAKSNPITWHG